jgi:hypothetical protein
MGILEKVGDVLFEDGRGVLFAPGPSGSDKEVPDDPGPEAWMRPGHPKGQPDAAF